MCAKHINTPYVHTVYCTAIAFNNIYTFINIADIILASSRKFKPIICTLSIHSSNLTGPIVADGFL
jgi:hypothetical protein